MFIVNIKMKELYINLIQIIPNTKMIINNKYIFTPKERYTFDFNHHYLTHDIPQVFEDINKININFDKYSSLEHHQ